jgi:hypothetical protein
MSRQDKQPAPTSSRPSVADALAKAARHNETKDGRQPGDVVNPEPGLAYYWLDPAEIDKGRTRKIRDSLEGRGYWKIENGGEYVPECSTAEIWATYQEVVDEHFEDRKRRNNAARKVFEDGVAARGESVNIMT